MSIERKKALAVGRAQGAAVRAYLDALESHRPKRGRKRTPESIQRRLAAIADQLAAASSTMRLELLQERRSLTRELNAMEDTSDLTALENGFISHALSYSQRKGIEYATWREFGVSPATLKAAGLTRGAS